MYQLLTHTFCYGCLIAVWCAGLRIASDKGAILYPVLLWLQGLKDSQRKLLQHKKDIEQQHLEWTKQSLLQALQKGEETKHLQNRIDLFQQQIQSIELQQMQLEFYHKPILSCIVCMPSLHGLLIGTFLFFYLPHFKPEALLFAIPLATSILQVYNVYVLKRI